MPPVFAQKIRRQRPLPSPPEVPECSEFRLSAYPDYGLFCPVRTKRNV